MRHKGFLKLPIYSAMIKNIYHHYNPDVDIEEHHNRTQKKEQKSFISLLGKSNIILRLKDFLFCKGMLSVSFTVVVVHWQKLRDCFLKAIVTVTHNGLPVIIVISHLTQPTSYCCGLGHSP